MKVLLVLSLSCLICSAWAGITIKEFEDEFHELWSDPEDEKAASEELKKEEASIEQHNADYAAGKSSFGEQLNELSALTIEEVEAEKEGLLDEGVYATGLLDTPEEERYDPENEALLRQIYDSMDRAYIPESFDARDHGMVTEPKNQMTCGSCAAFAATAVHETCMVKAGAPLSGLDLSEQQLVDCGYDGRSMNGCNGAFVAAYSQWLVGNKGLVNHEADYPYLDRDPNLKCISKPNWNAGAKVVQAAVDYNCNEEKLKQLVSQYGAVATAIYASDPAFGNAGPGVFDGCTQTGINHAVTIVGYGTENGKPYWIVKNSWGSHWGVNGYIKMYRGKGICGIGGRCAVTICQGTGQADPAPVAPPPPPVTPSQECDVSKLFGRSDLTGTYTLTVTRNGKKYESTVVCTNSICRPKIAGPSNACMYICGSEQC